MLLQLLKNVIFKTNSWYLRYRVSIT